MSTHTFFVDNKSVEIHDGWHQRVLFDNELVSDIKIGVRPRVRILHRFSTGDPPRRYEMHVYQGLSLGYLVMRDGELVKAQRPSYWWVVLSGLLFLANAIDYAADRKTIDLVSVVVWGAGFAIASIPLIAWSRAKRPLAVLRGEQV